VMPQPISWIQDTLSDRINRLSPNTRVVVPALMITAINDAVLKPEMSVGMGKYFDNLTQRSVPAGHWALIERPDAVNNILGGWMNSTVFGSKLLL
jgi:pimeloyl-ACP methyl ester carboxylesterase